MQFKLIWNSWGQKTMLDFWPILHFNSTGRPFPPITKFRNKPEILFYESNRFQDIPVLWFQRSYHNTSQSLLLCLTCILSLMPLYRVSQISNSRPEASHSYLHRGNSLKKWNIQNVPSVLNGNTAHSLLPHTTHTIGWMSVKLLSNDKYRWKCIG